jgi:hypothetical protein
MRSINITNKKYNKLTAIRLHQSLKITNKSRQYWLFKCDCGKEKIICKDLVKRGQIKSCGCIKGLNKVKHGFAKKSKKSRIYNIWCSMRQRCNNRNNAKYSSYGGRGIKVCEKWNSFENFLEDMGEPTTSKHSIDRIDNDGNYKPLNCRWATSHQQANNTRNNIIIKYNGEEKTLSEWCLDKNIIYSKALYRLNNGYSVETILEDKSAIRNDLVGTNNKRAKFTKEDIYYIISLFSNAKIPIRRIAKTFNVDFNTIKKILTGQSYKNIDIKRPLYPNKMEIVKNIEDSSRGGYGSTGK